ncbi:hypothetical protein [Corynebacterium macginleyi]|uniref:hypothetical protein n=1 Tax=Corynebacterium macginleyi TaxID=38290 RepID=UPI000EFA156E|nr:hypothetical protein [Corynebacterium macginleyi]QRP22526.1 hypothetical protein I6J25_05340 [Corynebacterium macginleyi]RMB68265.1 hypothetical protein D9V82_02575 [Corynebacterium macginleyi]
MFQLLNSRNNMVKQDSVRPQIVPSAAIWDVDDQNGVKQYSAYEKRGIRTLESGYRTNFKEYSNVETNFELMPDEAKKMIRQEDLHSSRSNYFLGGVFGAAVFVGTIAGGLMDTDAEVPTGPGGSIQQVEAAIVQ